MHSLSQEEMGWHYILRFKCTVLPEYIDFIKQDLLSYFSDQYPYSELDLDPEEDVGEPDEYLNTYRSLPSNYRNLIDLWAHLRIGPCCGSYTLEGDQLTYEFSKKVFEHRGDLQADYVSFMKDIIVPMTSEIAECSIESDDYGCHTWEYTDSQLRDVQFILSNKIRNIQHTYNSDHSEITETRVVYKHPIKRHQFIDLNRAYS
jgi:hypothetical protein